MHQLSVMFWAGLLVALGVGLRAFIRQHRRAIVEALKFRGDA